MKKIKIITGLATLATAGTTLGVLASCSCSKEIVVDIEGGSYDKNLSKIELNKKSTIYVIPAKDKTIKSIKRVIVGGTTLTTNLWDWKPVGTANATKATHIVTIEAAGMTDRNIVIEPEYETEPVGPQLKINLSAYTVKKGETITATVSLIGEATVTEIDWSQEGDGQVTFSKSKTTLAEQVTITGKTAGTVSITIKAAGVESATATIDVTDSTIKVTEITSVVFTGTKEGEAKPKDKFTSSKLKVRGKINSGAEQDLTIETHYTVQTNDKQDITAAVKAGTYELPDTEGTYTFSVVGVGQAGVSKTFDIKIVESATTINKATFITRMNTYVKNFSENVGLITPSCIKSATKGGTVVSPLPTQVANHFFDSTNNKAVDIPEISPKDFGIANTALIPTIQSVLPDDGPTVRYTEDSVNQVITMTQTDSTTNEIVGEFQMNGFGIFTKMCWSQIAPKTDYFTLEFDSSKIIGAPKIDISDASKTAGISMIRHLCYVNSDDKIKSEIRIQGKSTPPAINSVTLNGTVISNYKKQNSGKDTIVTFNDFMQLKDTDKIIIDAEDVEIKSAELTPYQTSFVALLPLKKYDTITITNNPSGTKTASWELENETTTIQKFTFDITVTGGTIKKEILVKEGATTFDVTFTPEEWAQIDDKAKITIDIDYVYKSCPISTTSNFDKYFSTTTFNQNPVMENQGGTTDVIITTHPTAEFKKGTAFIAKKSTPNVKIVATDIESPAAEYQFNLLIEQAMWDKLGYDDELVLNYEVLDSMTKEEFVKVLDDRVAVFNSDRILFTPAYVISGTKYDSEAEKQVPVTITKTGTAWNVQDLLVNKTNKYVYADDITGSSAIAGQLTGTSLESQLPSETTQGVSYTVDENTKLLTFTWKDAESGKITVQLQFNQFGFITIYNVGAQPKASFTVQYNEDETLLILAPNVKLTTSSSFTISNYDFISTNDGNKTQFQIIINAPTEPGTYSVKIGDTVVDPSEYNYEYKSSDNKVEIKFKNEQLFDSTKDIEIILN